MKRLIILFLFVTVKSYACDCKTPKTALEFFESEYVFKGKVTEKTYSNDLSTYTIKIDVLVHYKKSDSIPNHFYFTFNSIHNLEKTSCDFFIDKYEELLIYGKNNDNKLSFNLFCSNTKIITNKEINEKELLVLQNGNDFNLNNYIFNNDTSGFSFSRPLINIDSILLNVNKASFNKTSFVIIMLDMDEKGNLLKTNLMPRNETLEFEIKDSIFNLNIIKNKRYRKPENDFEKFALELIQIIKQWEPVIHQKSNLKVRFRKYVKLYFIDEKLIFEY
ncbi:hypothetical protein [Olleya sp. R77988]|uniref:hypothetical protein n=1 Tax=Olleya sp. R77988 TaxID=3093875 RepID=UPI0037C9BEC1